jgi:hypothetical protein
MAAGNGFTVTTAVLIHPVGNVYVIVAVPATTPVTVPDDIVATAVLPLLQAPPAVALVRDVVVPGHKAIVPVIAAGSGLTVAVTVAIQPVGKV